MSDKVIHFGHFVAWNREQRGWTLSELGGMIGRKERRVWGLEQLAVPPKRRATVMAIAKAFGIEFEKFDTAWRSTPVPVPERHANLEFKGRVVEPTLEEIPPDVSQDTGAKAKKRGGGRRKSGASSKRRGRPAKPR